MSLVEPSLRYYQERTYERLREAMARSKRRSVMVVAPTGSGKTHQATHLIYKASTLKKSALFLAHTKEIVYQTRDTLLENGINCGVIMAGEEGFKYSAVQVASKDTLVSRAMKRGSMQLPDADLVIVDEVHHALGAWYEKIIRRYPNAHLVGLTATPCRQDGRGLGDMFDEMVIGATYDELRQSGDIVPVRCFAPYSPDYREMSASGRLVNKKVQKKMDQPQLVGDIVGWWKKLGQDRQTVVFASGIDHSLHIQKEFQEAGIRCGHVDGTTDPDERGDMLAAIQDGRIRVLTNVGVCTEGWNARIVSCIVLARPTNSFGLYRQMTGRGLRPHEESGKVDVVLLDHAGCILRHQCFPDQDIDWPLEKSENVKNRVKKMLDTNEHSNPVVCPQCNCTFSGRPECPNCGYKIRRKPKKKEAKNGVLVEVSRHISPVEQVENYQRLWDRALAICAHKGRNPRSAVYIFKKSADGKLPWQVPGLNHMPVDQSEWSTPVGELYPGFKRN